MPEMQAASGECPMPEMQTASGECPVPEMRLSRHALGIGVECPAIRVVATTDAPCDGIEVILDSGADASCLPLWMHDTGVPSAANLGNFQDAQGHRLDVHA